LPLQQVRECLILEPRLLPVWWDSRQCSPYRTIALARASESLPIPSLTSNACPKAPHARQSLHFVPSGLPCQLLACRMKLTSSGYRHTWAWKEMQQPTKKPSEGACFHSHPLPWASLQGPRARVHRAFTGSQHCYQHWQRDWSRDQCVTVAQVRTGHSPLAAAYLHHIRRWDSAHTVKAPKIQLNIRCSNVRPTIRPGGTCGLETFLQQTRDASGATWNGLGR